MSNTKTLDESAKEYAVSLGIGSWEHPEIIKGFIAGYNYALSPLEQSEQPYSRHQENDPEHLSAIFQKVTCNGSREMTEERFIQAVVELPIPRHQENGLEQSEPFGYLFEGAFVTKENLLPEWAYTDNERPVPLYRSPVEQSENKEEWVSVAERLPLVPCWVLVVKTSSPHVIGLYYNSAKKFKYGHQNHTKEVTHWKYLPKPPKNIV